MKTSAILATAAAASAFYLGCTSFSARPAADCDIVIYGSTPAAISAAIQAKRMGLSAVVVSPETRIGGLTTGGLGQTDIGNKGAFGGIALEFYTAVADHYGNPSNLVVQFPDEEKRKSVADNIRKDGSKWTFEPSAALSILEGWEKRDGLDFRRGEWLDRKSGVEKKDGRIVAIRTLSGKVYRGTVFIDATYEGDLMAAAGVSYHVGREANSVYGETLNGNEPEHAKFHQLHKGVDPYAVPGNPSSGLLPGIEPYDPGLKPGDGDSRVQAYCFRMCLTDNPDNRIPFAKPEGYDERDYELMFRHLALGPLDRNGMPWINSRMPNRKTDTNNRTGFSTDFIGQNWNWPEASYAEREKILAAHLKYQKGLMWALANHPRVPDNIRAEVSRWGTCKDEFKDGFGDGWQRQLYVREARRMVGEYVMTEANCRGKAIAPRPIAMGAYQMDSHHVRRYVTKEGFVQNEGDVEVGTGVGGKRFPPYPIDYGAIVPKRAECGNLLVPVCLSASHIAFGSIRMEPVFFALGQAAGTAAAIAAGKRIAVQDVPYEELSDRLLADRQVLECSQAAAPRWSVEKARSWGAKNPWWCGVNYIPANAINYTAMWDRTSFSPDVIRKELALMKDLGMNCVRFVMQYKVYEEAPVHFLKSLDKFLALCDEAGVKAMPIFFDDCAFGANTDPVTGKQPEPLKGWYAWAWSPSPGHTMVIDERTHPKLERYVKRIMERFKDDRRIFLWDLYNEPENGKLGARALPLLRKVFRWAREVNPSQPISSGIWNGNKDLNEFLANSSDVITFHCYANAKKTAARIKEIEKLAKGRPIICTEWMNRTVGSTVEACLPLFKATNVGCIAWGLVNGKTQTHLRWGHRPEHLPYKGPWQHDLYRGDFTPYDQKELDLIKTTMGK